MGRHSATPRTGLSLDKRYGCAIQSVPVLGLHLYESRQAAQLILKLIGDNRSEFGHGEVTA